MKDMINLGATPNRIKWVFPRAFLDAANGSATNKERMASEFLELINSKKFQRLGGPPLNNVDRYREIIIGLGGRIDPSTGRGVIPSSARIIDMLESAQ